MTKLSESKRIFVAFLLGAMTITAQAQKFTVLANLPTASYGLAPLAQGMDGNFYGTTVEGIHSNGTVFKVTADGQLTQLHNFNDFYNGMFSQAGLALAGDGTFYGMTYAGGNSGGNCGQNGCGTIYRITPKGNLTTVHKFDYTDGVKPYFALDLGIDGNLYGTTVAGGVSALSTSQCPCGTVFRMIPTGEETDLTTLVNFQQGRDGGFPEGGLVQGTDGNFYGTTTSGGDPICDCGTIFKISPAGEFTTLHRFSGSEAAPPFSGLVQGSEGNFYGVTGGGNQNCSGGCGTIFKVTPQGELTTVYAFNSQDGAYPEGPLVQATDGNLYGVTSSGGGLGGQHCDLGCGTIFQLGTSGRLTTLHLFSFTDGAFPNALIQSTNGVFYATTNNGGSNYGGVVFSLDMGLAPFVTFVRFAGRVGQTGPLLGQGFTGTTSVSINGIQADFTVVSDTLLRATVPQDATTGYVTVSTPTGVLTSNVPFHVIQ